MKKTSLFFSDKFLTQNLKKIKFNCFKNRPTHDSNEIINLPAGNLHVESIDSTMLTLLI